MSFLVFTSPFSASITFEAIPGAIRYRVTYGSQMSTSTSSIEISVYDIEESTGYTFVLEYTTDDITYIDSGEFFIGTSPPNVPTSYDLSTFLTDEGYDLTILNNETQTLVLNIAPTLFSNDDVIITSGSNYKIASNNSTVNVTSPVSLLLPFSEGGSPDQNVNISGYLTDSLMYDETSNTVTVNSRILSVGDSTIVDGVRITIYEI